MRATRSFEVLVNIYHIPMHSWLATAFDLIRNLFHLPSEGV